MAIKRLVNKGIHDCFLTLMSRAKVEPNLQNTLMVERFLSVLDVAGYQIGAMKSVFLSSCLNNNNKVVELPLTVFIEARYGTIDSTLFRLVSEQATEVAKEFIVPEDGVKSALKTYIKRADRILKKNIELSKKEEAIKQERVALDKEEKDFIQELEDIGLQSLRTTDGYTLSVIEQYHCNINKSMDDQDNVAQWLKAHGGEDLVSSVAEVGEKDIPTLKELGVPLIEKYSMNTNKVKAFIKSGLGITGEQVQFEWNELPKGLHFFTDRQIKIE